MAELKIDLIVDNKGSIQIQKFGMDAERAFYQATGSVNGLKSSVDGASSSLFSFGNVAKGAIAYLSIESILQFGQSVANVVVQVDSLERSLAAITGSQQAAAQEMQFLRETADDTGQNFYKLSDGYRQLTASTMGTNLEGKKTRDVFVGVSEAAAVLGLSQERVDLSIRALGQMASKGVVQMEELKNQLGDHIPGAVQIAARALGVTTQELYDMSKSGDLLAEDVLPAIASELHRMYGEAAQTASLESGQAAVNKLSESWTDFKANIANSQMVIDTIWGIAHALEGLSAFVAPGLNIDVGMAVFGGSAFDDLTTKELQLKRIAYLEKDISASEQEISRIQGNANRQGASQAQAAALEKLNGVVRTHRAELESLNKATNNQSPFVTGDAIGKINTSAEAFGHLGFTMQGVRAESAAEKKASEEAHKETLKYIETREQAAAKEYATALAGARTDEERGAAKKKYEEQISKLQEKQSKAGESAANKAAKAAERQQKEYQSIIDRLLPLEKAQRDYNESLAALDQMDPSKSTERYQLALANLNREYQSVVDNANRYTKAIEEAQQAAKESELSRQGTAIEISIAQGGMTEKEALPFRIDLAEQKLKAYQDRLSNMPKFSSDDISAWNSQADAIAATTLELAKLQEQARLQITTESFKKGMQEWAVSVDDEMLDFYRTSLPNALDSSSNALAQFFRDFSQGNSDLSDSWKALGQTIENTVYDIIQDLIQLQIKMAAMQALGLNSQGGIASGGLISSIGGWLSSGVNYGTYSDVSALTSGSLFANGGIMTESGPLQLRQYASGGIATSPQVSIYGEGSKPEAYVPLPDGRSIPVTMSGPSGGNNVVVNVIEDTKKAGTTQNRTDNGTNVIAVFVDRIKNAVASDIVSGSGVVPNALQSTYGLNRSFGGN